MHKNEKLSLAAAILININVMLGAGIFINVTELTQRAGMLGALSYCILGVLLFPLILSFAYLLNKFPSGNFYAFGAHALGPFMGFLNTWSYFIGKLGSATLAIHISVLLLQQLMPTLLIGSSLWYDLAVLGVYILLNLLRISTGSKIQYYFLGMKLVPVLFIIGTGLWLFNPSYFSSTAMIWQGIPSTLPLVLFAALGFEVACSLSNKIENPQKNGPIVVLISYSIVMVIAFLYQIFFYGLLGPSLGAIASFKAGFPLVSAKLAISPHAQNALLALLNIGIASSALGGSYGILFSNSWNLYLLAQKNTLPRSSSLTKLNRYDIPWVCVVTEGIICLLYFLITGGNQVALQQMASFACVLTYTISIFSLLIMYLRGQATLNGLIPFLALINCIILLASCVYSFFIHGMYALVLFLALLATGIALFFWNKNKIRLYS